jgi:hypothetical protein
LLAKLEPDTHIINATLVKLKPGADRVEVARHIDKWVYFQPLRDGLSNRWRQIAVLQMGRAAQHLEIRLNNPISLIESFARTGREPGAEEIQGWLLKELQSQDGVGQVRLTWQGSGKARARVVKASPQ